MYNVSPDRQAIVLGHGSATLPKSFEVEGFTIQGRVKGHSGANILVNGVLKATSGHDGTFSIPNVKPGSYEFEVTAGRKTIQSLIYKAYYSNFAYYFRQVPF